jgi:hypothetical protein
MANNNDLSRAFKNADKYNTPLTKAGDVSKYSTYAEKETRQDRAKRIATQAKAMPLKTNPIAKAMKNAIDVTPGTQNGR